MCRFFETQLRRQVVIEQQLAEFKQFQGRVSALTQKLRGCNP
jgi:hypothetical protein